MRLLVAILVAFCTAIEAADSDSARAGLRVMVEWADSDKELTVEEVAVTLYTMRHLRRALSSQGEAVSPLFWAWLGDFEAQTEAIMAAKNDLFTLNVLTNQFRSDMKIFLAEFGSTPLGPLSKVSSDDGWTDDSDELRSIACYVDAPGVDVTNCGGGIVFDRVEDAINHRNELSGVDIGVVVKTSRELDRVKSSGISPKWVLASSKRLAQAAESSFKGALVSRGGVLKGVVANFGVSGFVLASRVDTRLYGLKRLGECGREKGYTVLRDPTDSPTSATAPSISCEIPSLETETIEKFPHIHPDYIVRAELKLASGQLPGIASEHLSRKAVTRLHEELLENDYAVYLPDAFTKETFEEILAEVERLWRIGENKTSGMEANCNLDGNDRMGGGRVHDQVTRPGSALWGADFPMELREYGRKSKGMPCHADLQMYKSMETDWEVVVTVSNSAESRCEFTWTNKNGEKRVVRTTANSVTLVRPNSAVHCVTSTAGGRREMLKMIFTGDYRKDGNFW
ncbi:hypothetical protein Pmar_PMAR004743, partial [Perkinsus marinus ATCC 50983]